jgi:hypothetical protein
LGLLWLGIGGPTDLQRHDNAAERENPDVLPPNELGHRCFTCAVEIKN